MAATKDFEAMVAPAAEAREPLDLESVYRRHAPLVSTWVKRLWGPGDAQDLLHEVFLVAQRRLPEFRGDAAISTWLYSITVRVVVDRRKKERWRRWLWRRAAPEIEAEERAVETPLGTALREQAARTVYAILDEMSERDRMLLILFEMEGLSARRIANVLGTSENAVWVGLHRARARFRAAYSKRFGESETGDPDVQTR
jgi:RNA polymerase sigma-70 factor (ECF subfamily)